MKKDCDTCLYDEYGIVCRWDDCFLPDLRYWRPKETETMGEIIEIHPSCNNCLNLKPNREGGVYCSLPKKCGPDWLNWAQALPVILPFYEDAIVETTIPQSLSLALNIPPERKHESAIVNQMNTIRISLQL